eukprot:214604_1
MDLEDVKQKINEARHKAEQKSRTFNCKVVVLGDTRVGKTSLLVRIVKNEFDTYKEPTIGASFMTQTIGTADGTNTTLRVECFDTAGHETYHSLAQLYYRHGDFVIVVYDITHRETFEIAKRWVKEVTTVEGDHIRFLLIGNKCDLESHRMVSTDEAMRWATKHGTGFIETSAKENKNMDILKDLLRQKATEKLKKDGDEYFENKSKNVIIDQPKKEIKKENKCCKSV